MIAQTFYLSASIEDEPYQVNDTIDSIMVPKQNKFLFGLRPDHDIVYTLMTIDEVERDREGAFVKIHNAVVIKKQVLDPSLIETIIDYSRESIYDNSGVILEWAFEHKFRSVIIYYLKKYPTLCKFIDKLIYRNISHNNYGDMIIFLIKNYKYDVFKENNRLFKQAAMCKNYVLCEYLLEETSVPIPANVYKIYMNYGKHRYQHMWDLLKKYTNRVELS